MKVKKKTEDRYEDAFLAHQRLVRFGSRAEVLLTDGSPPAGEPAKSCDRFVSNFVLDLLAEEDIAAVVREAHRMLGPEGRLCLSSLSMGGGALSRWLARLWTGVHSLRPALVGGCRPINLREYLPSSKWRMHVQARVTPLGLPLEAVVAEPC